MKQLTLLLFSFSFCLSGYSQVKFEKFIPNSSVSDFYFELPTGNIDWEFGDLDGDGDLDLVVSGSGPRIFLNDGSGKFTEELSIAPFPFASPFGDYDVNLADFDNDGDLDLFVYGGTTVSRFARYENNGAGVFTSRDVSETFSGAGMFGEGPGKLIVSDLNNDSYVDFVVSNRFDDVKVFLNDATGDFDQSDSFSIGENLDEFIFDAGDLNGDGLKDIIGANEFALAQLDGTYLNPQDWTSSAFSSPRALFDIDDDGDLDIVSVGTPFGEQSTSVSGTLNDGNANFSGFISLSGPLLCPDICDGSIILRIEDFDLDGFSDIIVTTSEPFQTNVIFQNNGNGNYTTITSEGPQVNGKVSFQDINGDGLVEILRSGVDSTGFRYNSMFINEGINLVELRDTDFKSYSFVDAINSDFDLDGDQDIVVFDYTNDLLDTYLNDGVGNFSLGFSRPFNVSVNPFESRRDRKLIDYDGDGDKDIYFFGLVLEDGEFVLNDRIYLNTGGDFNLLPEVDIPFVNEGLEDLIFEDVDLNGTLDIVIIARNSNDVYFSRILLNDGSNNYTEFGFNAIVPVREATINAGNLNDDEWPDIWITGRNTGNNTLRTQVLINQEHAIFLQSEVDNLPEEIKEFLPADVDSDGDLDFFKDDVTFFGDRINIFLNDGNGVFEQIPSISYDDGDFDIIGFPDADFDGDVDFVLYDRPLFGNPRLIFNENNSSAGFRTIQLPEIPAADDFAALLFTDFTGDSLPDIFIAGELDNDVGSGESFSTLLYKNVSTPCQDSNGNGFCTDEYNCTSVSLQGIFDTRVNTAVGNPCNDGNFNTDNDVVDDDCNCLGTFINRCYLADLNLDGTVDLVDLDLFLPLVGTTCTNLICEGDFNVDGIIDVGDLLILQGEFGNICSDTE